MAQAADAAFSDEESAKGTKAKQGKKKPGQKQPGMNNVPVGNHRHDHGGTFEGCDGIMGEGNNPNVSFQLGKLTEAVDRIDKKIDEINRKLESRRTNTIATLSIIFSAITLLVLLYKTFVAP